VTLHGGGHSKEVVGPSTVNRVVSAGVTLVAIDLYLHGEHFDGDAASIPWGDDGLAAIVAHTAAELPAAVADLAQDRRIEGRAIGARGESLGGSVVLTAVLDGAPLAAAVSLAGLAPEPPSDERQRAPLLMINGVRDELAPAAAAAVLHRKMSASAAAGDDCVVVVHGGGHETPDAFDALGWWWILDRLRRRSRA
jgi:dienelactone hydrolase